jgi:hypothetical protein
MVAGAKVIMTSRSIAAGEDVAKTLASDGNIKARPFCQLSVNNLGTCALAASASTIKLDTYIAVAKLSVQRLHITVLLHSVHLRRPQSMQ